MRKQRHTHVHLETWVSSGDPGKCVRQRQGTIWFEAGLGVSGDWGDWPGCFHVVMETSQAQGSSLHLVLRVSWKCMCCLDLGTMPLLQVWPHCQGLQGSGVFGTLGSRTKWSCREVRTAWVDGWKEEVSSCLFLLCLETKHSL